MPGNDNMTGNEPTPEELAAMEAMEMRAKEQKAALEEAHEALTEALAETLNTQAALDAANAAHMALTAAIAAAADVSAADKAKYEDRDEGTTRRYESARPKSRPPGGELSNLDVLPVLKRRGFSGLQAAFWSVPSPSFSNALPGR